MTFEEFKTICELHGLTINNVHYQNSWVKRKVRCVKFFYDNSLVFSYLLENNRIQCVPYSHKYVEEWDRKVYLNKKFKVEHFEKHLKEFILAYKKSKIQDRINSLESDFE